MKNHIKKVAKFQKKSAKSLSFFADLKEQLANHNELLDGAIKDMEKDIAHLQSLTADAYSTKAQNQMSMNHIGKIIGE
ncbi:hypothetical protein [Paenibacillus hexagrammi]|uniref:Uncharacterized protein n=1 Tax=Paenibacillus hexagrammi TaxID=2908839 RepID=A0ABY3STL9_9BACL|nr:hypothetical protein [Paenibacillus sp. YPD9-1]UJF36594.1 hypothetical protein L0M14_30360 [Paenibacillus sp. YPD9-1]